MTWRSLPSEVLSNCPIKSDVRPLPLQRKADKNDKYQDAWGPIGCYV